MNHSMGGIDVAFLLASNDQCNPVPIKGCQCLD